MISANKCLPKAFLIIEPQTITLTSNLFMKKLTTTVLLTCCLVIGLSAYSQTIYPKVIFKDNPQTHNMHITSDGQYLYTCNGGKPDKGQISKFTTSGNKIGSYSFDLDMRSIMYNASDKKLYVNTYSQKLYRIVDLTQGIYTEVLDLADHNEQSAPAISPNGKLIYFNDFGTVQSMAFKNNKVKDTFTDLKTTDNAADGGTAVAVSNKHIYTWDAAEQLVYVYDLKGRLKKTLQLTQGDYGFSLSWANDLLWVSTDGNYEEGTWFGYEVE
jgi:6-phosphogluconolactonase (cycloisomerase 2 family)